MTIYIFWLAMNLEGSDKFSWSTLDVKNYHGPEQIICALQYHPCANGRRLPFAQVWKFILTNSQKNTTDIPTDTTDIPTGSTDIPTGVGPIQRLFTMALTLSKGWTKSGKILVECDQFL